MRCDEAMLLEMDVAEELHAEAMADEMELNDAMTVASLNGKPRYPRMVGQSRRAEHNTYTCICPVTSTGHLVSLQHNIRNNLVDTVEYRVIVLQRARR